MSAKFAQVTHEYLIELQFTGSESIPMNQENVKIKLNFNHPVKELSGLCATTHVWLAGPRQLRPLQLRRQCWLAPRHRWMV
jgi:hypothetical protein